MTSSYDPALDAKLSYDAAVEAKKARGDVSWPKPTLNQARARELFIYDAASGALIWNRRLRSDFPSKLGWAVWNGRYAGKPAGHLRKDGYRSIRIDGIPYLAHRLIWLLSHGSFPALFIDHINGDPSDNRLTNLREVTVAENGQNAKRSRRNSTGVVGVRWVGKDRRWRAEITANCESTHLGDFVILADAIEARLAAEERYGFHPNHGRNA